MSEEVKNFITKFQLRYPNLIMDETVAEEVFKVAGEDFEELEYRLTPSKHETKIKRHYIKCIEDDFPNQKTKILSCKPNKEIVFINIETDGILNNNNILVEIINNDLYISYNGINLPKRFKLFYYCIEKLLPTTPEKIIYITSNIKQKLSLKK